MKRSLVSNPPYNMKWSIPPFAQMQPRFFDCELPPESNANFAFVLTAINEAERAVLLLPCGVLAPSKSKNEKAIRKYLVDANLIDVIITCPDGMFESTGVATCILVLDKNKQTTNTMMIDMRETFEIENREQNGQYGSSSHTGRTYTKQIKIFSEAQIQKVLDTIREHKDIDDFSKNVPMQKIQEDNYSLLPSHYFDIVIPKNIHRPFSDIVNDINRVVNEKNCCKLTMNETLARNFGFDLKLYKPEEDNDEMNAVLKQIGAEPLVKKDYFATSKKKNEIKFENTSKEMLSSILIMILDTWKQHIFYLNQEENRYLAELRDALLPDLMSGKLKVTGA